MNITTKNSIAEIVNAIMTLPYPERPKKPSMMDLGRNPTPDDFRNHAALLEEYERKEEAYKDTRTKYAETTAALEKVYVDKLRLESLLSGPVFDLVYSKAYENAHSDGFFAVASEFEELESFVIKVIDANK
jgi:hypothetical protein